MRLKFCLIFLVLLKTTASFGQEVDTVKLFFGINEYQLSNDNQAKLDALYKILNYNPRINIIGYADFLGDDPKNLRLSVNRTETARTYLLCLNKNLLITTDGRGTVPATKMDLKNGDPVSRRVDIIIQNRAGIKFPRPFQAPGQKQAIQPMPDAIIAFNKKINKLSTLDTGASISLDELTFEPGRHVLNPESEYYLKTLLTYLKANEKVNFEIRGHICCDYNNADGYDLDTHIYGLSLTRAKFIYDFLLQNGVAAKRMRYTGVGSRQPKIYPEMTDRDKMLNRRVEIVIAR